MEFLAFEFKAGQIPTFRKDWRLEGSVEAVLSINFDVTGISPCELENGTYSK